MSAIVENLSAMQSEPWRGAAVDLATCADGAAGAADTIGGLRLDDEVADQLLHVLGTPWTQGRTAEVKDSHAGGLHEHSEAAECVTSKSPRSGLYVTQSALPRVQLADFGPSDATLTLWLRYRGSLLTLTLALTLGSDRQCI